MGTVRQKRAAKNTNKNTRRTADRHKKRVTIHGNPIIKKNWDKKLTLKQNYEKLGLLTSLNGETGGKEKMKPDAPVEVEAETEPKDLKDMTEEEIEQLKKTLNPGEGLIQRDDEGNIVRIIVGEKKSHDEILDAEVPKVEAKTDVVRQLEELAANAVHHEKYQSEYETDWVQKLISKHGDDYKAMFWDKELNIYQQTAAQLKKKCQAYAQKNKK
ncbi:ribosome biogenesis protein Nop16 [Choanephora cucurbitarum]|nr:ribosome biogenesis protein Nop16 [Choanephora cucurbitarum]